MHRHGVVLLSPRIAAGTRYMQDDIAMQHNQDVIGALQ
jgi:hypothetical protein